MRARDVLALLVVTLAAACASSDAAPAASTACAKEPAGWPDPPPPGSVCVAGVSGRALELGGAPLGAALVSVCGRACFSANAGDDGRFRVPVGASLAPGQFTLEVHGRPDHAELYLPMPAAALETEVGDLAVPALPPSDVSLPEDGAPATSLTVGALTLAVPGGTSFQLALEDVAAGAPGRIFRVAAVPVALAPAFAKDAGAALVFALAPATAQPSAKVGVRIAGAGGLAAGTPVELLVLIADYVTMPNRSGTLEVAATGHVTADGAAIETDPGEGIGLLTWIVVRPK